MPLQHFLSLLSSSYSTSLIPFPSSTPPTLFYFFLPPFFPPFLPPSFLLLPISCFSYFRFPFLSRFSSPLDHFLHHRTHRLFIHHLYLLFPSFLLFRHFFFFLIVFFPLFFGFLPSTQSIFLHNQLI